ncbi:MAG: ComEA family DNA-binding protein [Candidatus Hydrogenedentes bacterium]|nr:ComEA family DNA-binding protein [Candidatus Hydrogenedentota bacterium]
MGKKICVLAGSLVLLGLVLGIGLYFTRWNSPIEDEVFTAIEDLEPLLESGDVVAAPIAAADVNLAISLIEPTPVHNGPSVVVSVAGAVRRAGTYTFQEGQRVQAALNKAGGFLEDADMSDINIAASLIDCSDLYIPFQEIKSGTDQGVAMRRSALSNNVNTRSYTRSGWQAPSAKSPGLPIDHQTGAAASETYGEAAAAPKVTQTNGLIDLNTASLTELQQLPGIGPKTAEKIVAYREQCPFQKIEDLMEVSGIGEKKFDAVRLLIRVE